MTDREAFRRRSRRGNTTPRMPLCVATRNPREPQRRTLRLTHLYRRENGEWKVIQEHSDFQPADHVMPTVPDSVGR